MRRAVVLVVVLLVGCGSSSKDDPRVPFAALVKAQTDGDARAACAQYSRGYLRDLGRLAGEPGKGRAVCERAVREQMKDDESRLGREGTRVVGAKRAGDRATVALSIPYGKLDATVRARSIREGGEWKIAGDFSAARVKRVVGLPGDRIAVRGGLVHRNGRAAR